MKKYPSIIKWSGSKRLVATQLAEHFPTFKRYFEPFVGGGSMLPYSNGKVGFASDIISELINLWETIKQNPDEVAKEYRTRWEKLQKEGPDIYYEVRDSFNKTRNSHDFLFLTRTCVNGLIRFNSDGDFNNSFHLSRAGIAPNRLEPQLYLWSKAIQNITFKACDYRDTLSIAEKGDFVFLDPPYGGTKGRYQTISFDIEAFFSELERLNSIGVKWMLTFDGKAGERTYSFAPPAELYKSKFPIFTGNSAFTKLENKKLDKIEESVYTNYKIIHESLNLFKDID